MTRAEVGNVITTRILAHLTLSICQAPGNSWVNSSERNDRKHSISSSVGFYRTMARVVYNNWRGGLANHFATKKLKLPLDVRID